VISKVTPSFWRTLSLLGATDQQAARRAYRLFAENPAHNSLRFKKLAGHPSLWSVRVTLNVRAVGERSGDTITWVWIGSHNDFDKLFG
jgi:hypothetical protein